MKPVQRARAQCKRDQKKKKNCIFSNDYIDYIFNLISRDAHHNGTPPLQRDAHANVYKI